MGNETMTQEQNPGLPTAQAPEEVGSLDAAALAFQQREEALAQPEQEAEAETETQDDDPDAEASDGESDEDTDEPEELVDAELEGKHYKVPPAVHKAMLRQADYSRNMNEFSQAKKVLTQRSEHVEVAFEAAAKKADALATVKLIEHQLKQYEALDFNQIKAEDPARASLIGFEYLNAKQQLEQAKDAADAVDATVIEARGKVLQSQRVEMFAALKKAIPTWSDKEGQALTEWHISRGGSFEELQTMTDARRVVDMHKAMKYDRLQAGKAELKAKVKDAAPVLKPGVRPVKPSQQEDAMTLLRKFKTRDAAEVAFLARMK